MAHHQDTILAFPIKTPIREVGLSTLAGRWTWEGPLRLTRLVLDTDQFDFHLDVAPDYLPAGATIVLDVIRGLGFEPIPEDECEPELLNDGWTRIYLVPTIPVDYTPLIPAKPNGFTGHLGKIAPLVLVGAVAALASLGLMDPTVDITPTFSVLGVA